MNVTSKFGYDSHFFITAQIIQESIFRSFLCLRASNIIGIGIAAVSEIQYKFVVERKSNLQNTCERNRLLLVSYLWHSFLRYLMRGEKDELLDFNQPSEMSETKRQERTIERRVRKQLAAGCDIKCKFIG